MIPQSEVFLAVIPLVIHESSFGTKSFDYYKPKAIYESL